MAIKNLSDHFSHTVRFILNDGSNKVLFRVRGIYPLQKYQVGDIFSFVDDIDAEDKKLKRYIIDKVEFVLYKELVDEEEAQKVMIKDTEKDEPLYLPVLNIFAFVTLIDVDNEDSLKLLELID